VWLETNVRQRSLSSKILYSGVICLPISILLIETAALYYALESLLTEKDDIPGGRAIFYLMTGLLGVLIAILYSVRLRYELREDAERRTRAERRAAQIKRSLSLPAESGLGWPEFPDSHDRSGPRHRRGRRGSFGLSR
jgi:hypothetical protein